MTKTEENIVSAHQDAVYTMHSPEFLPTKYLCIGMYYLLLHILLK